MLRSVCSTGRWMDAEKLLADMPSVVTFNILINFLCMKGLIGGAIDIRCFTGFNCKEKKMDRAIKYLERMVSRGCYPDIVTYNNTMLTALCKDRKVEDAVEILNLILIQGIAYEGMAKEALELLNELCNKGLMKRSSAGKCSSK